MWVDIPGAESRRGNPGCSHHPGGLVRKKSWVWGSALMVPAVLLGAGLVGTSYAANTIQPIAEPSAIRPPDDVSMPTVIPAPRRPLPRVTIVPPTVTPSPTATPSATPSPAADLPGVSAEDAQLMRNQEALRAVAVQLIGEGPEDERYLIPGFAGITVSPADNTIHLYWKGRAPANVEAVRASLPPGITVTVHPARFSLAEMREAQDDVVSVTGQESPALTRAGARISRIGPISDGSGLRVTYDDATPPAATGLSVADQLANATRDRLSGNTQATEGLSQSINSTLRAQITSGVDSALERLVTVPVFTSFEPLAQTSAGRQNDKPSWFGGAALRSPTGKYCSTGFGATRFDGRHVILTASHCAGYAVNGNYEDPTGEYVGKISGQSARRDVALILTNAGVSTGNRVWFGSPRENADSRVVNRSAFNYEGELVCTSGAATGIHCSSRITCDACSNRTADGVFHSPVIIATRTTRSTSVGSGDSGGPVVALEGNRVVAKGIISSGNGVTGCSSLPVINATCYRTVNYIPIRSILSDFDLTLHVGG